MNSNLIKSNNEYIKSVRGSRLKLLKENLKGKAFEVSTMTSLRERNLIDMLMIQFKLEFYCIFVASAGEGIHEVDFQRKAIKAGDLLLLSQGRFHHFIECESLEGYFIIFTEEFLFSFFEEETEEVLKLFNDTYYEAVVSISEDEKEIIFKQLDKLKGIFQNDERDLKNDMINSSFKSLNSIIRESLINQESLKAKNNYIFRKFSKLIETNIKDEKSVEGYSKLLNVSKKTINLSTRKSVNISAKRFIIEKIIQDIKVNLYFEAKTLEQIAEDLGFSEAHNLSKFFKKYTGLTPTEFRQL